MIAVPSSVRQVRRAPAERRVEVCGRCNGRLRVQFGLAQNPVLCRCGGEGLVWAEVRLVVPGRDAA